MFNQNESGHNIFWEKCRFLQVKERNVIFPKCPLRDLAFIHVFSCLEKLTFKNYSCEIPLCSFGNEFSFGKMENKYFPSLFSRFVLPNAAMDKTKIDSWRKAEEVILRTCKQGKFESEKYGHTGGEISFR